MKGIKSPITPKEVRRIKRNMAIDKNQVLIFNDAELGLIKATFTDNDDLLYIIRKVLLQFELSEEEKIIIRGLSSEVYDVVKKRMFPDFDDQYPLTQIPNMLAGLTTDIRSRKVEDMEGLFDAKQLEIDYLEQQFRVLKDLETEENIKLSDLANLKGKTLDEKFVNVTAYLWLMGHVDPMLVWLKNIAGAKSESVEQAKERMTKNSNK